MSLTSADGSLGGGEVGWEGWWGWKPVRGEERKKLNVCGKGETQF